MPKDNIDYYLQNNYKCLYSISEFDKECLQIYSTFTYFADSVINKKLTCDRVEIYKDDRKYGNLPLVHRNNGIHNYTLHKITCYSKYIGKLLGMTYNKEILLTHNNNDLIK